MNTRNMPKDFIERLKTLKEKLIERFPEIDVPNLCKMMAKIAHFHYNRRKFMVTGFERELYNWLIENSYNPYTVYRWLLLEKVPDDIRFQLRQNYISQKKAFSEAFKRRHETDSVLAVSIKEIGLNLIRRM